MNRLFTSLLAGSAVLLNVTSASAQTPQESRPERPYRGVYASGTDQAQQVLTVNGSVSSGYDTNAQLGAVESGIQAISGDPRSSAGSVYTNYNGGLSYTAVMEKLSAGASLSSSTRQYPSSDLSPTSSLA